MAGRTISINLNPHDPLTRQCYSSGVDAKSQRINGWASYKSPMGS